MKKNLENLMKEYLQVLLPYVINNQPIPATQEEKLHDLQAKIIEILLFGADKPLFVSDKKMKGIFDVVLPHLLNRNDFQFLFDRLDSSGKSVDITWNYLDRFLKLKPFLLFSNLPQNVNILLSDAIRSYLYSCNRAAVILCGALLEEILRSKLSEIDPSLVFKNDNGAKPYQLEMKYIIKNAIKHEIMDKNLERKARHVNTERNAAVHRCKPFAEKETLSLITKTKEIIEDIYE